MKTSHLVIGLGEVGSAVATVLGSKYQVDTLDKEVEPASEKDVLHICFPYSDIFIEEVNRYRKKYKAKLVIVYSSVPVGTCKKIYDDVVHSPIEGRHPRLSYSTQAFTRWIGCNNPKTGKWARDIWGKITKCRVVDSTDYTEFLKLASTSKFGINLVWAEYMSNCAEMLEMDFEYTKQWDEDYNYLYRKLKMPQFQKYILDDPNGEIGGHCVTQNAHLLSEVFPDDMLDFITEMEVK